MNVRSGHTVTYQVLLHLIQKPKPDEASIGPGGRLVYEEAHLIKTKLIQTILEDVDH